MYFHKTLNNLSIHPWKPSFYELENVEQFSSSSATGWTSEGGHGLFSGERWGDPGEASHIYRYLFSSHFLFFVTFSSHIHIQIFIRTYLCLLRIFFSLLHFLHTYTDIYTHLIFFSFPHTQIYSSLFARRATN